MPPRRRSRGAARTTRRQRVPSSPGSDGDEHMADADPEVDEEQEADPDQDSQIQDVAADDEDATSPPAADSDDASKPPSPKPRPTRGRRGRPPRFPRPHDFATPEPGNASGSESGTPRRRGRGGFRGWRGGFRGRGKRGSQGPSHTTRVPVDKEGNTLDVVNDEIALEEDDEGETKVDKDGILQGGREYRVRTFTILGRDDRLYMLSTEPARCTGYRDSYLFFTKHPHLFKIIIDDDEKKDLIDREVLPNSYKGRAIGVVTARSVYREFGARIVVGGKRVTDDYYAEKARAEGAVEGELADPYDKLPAEGQPYNRNQYVAWHGASSVYHSNAPSMPMQNGKPIGKRRAAITSANWMLEHAREASRFNSVLAAVRKPTLKGVYDPHTNLMCYPKIMQPTHAQWEQVDTSATIPSQHAVNGLVNGNAADDTHQVNGVSREPLEFTGFAKPPSLVSRNYLVVDTHFITPPHASLPPPGPRPQASHLSALLDDEIEQGGHPGGLPELSEADLAEFPAEARTAYLQQRDMQKAWRDMWGTESTDGSRGTLSIGLGI